MLTPGKFLHMSLEFCLWLIHPRIANPELCVTSRALRSQQAPTSSRKKRKAVSLKPLLSRAQLFCLCRDQSKCVLPHLCRKERTLRSCSVLCYSVKVISTPGEVLVETDSPMILFKSVFAL